MAVSSLFVLFSYIYLLFWRFICLFVGLCECTCVCIFECIFMCVEALSQNLMVRCCFFEMVSPISLVFANLVRLPGQLVPEIHLSLSPQYWNYKHMLSRMPTFIFYFFFKFSHFVYTNVLPVGIHIHHVSEKRALDALELYLWMVASYSMGACY